MKKLFLLFTTLGVIGGLVFYIDYYMSLDAESKIYSDIQKVPPKRAALVLGTSKYLRNGLKNYYYSYRIEAASKLFHAGKIKAIIVSGDNSTKDYDEPTLMKEDLVKAGVPEKFVTIDYAGFRTLDSIYRAKVIFGLEDYIIVSQKFHLQRALFIAKSDNQKAIGFVAKEIPNTIAAKKMKFRELLARTKAFLDLYILNKKPKYYGKKEIVYYK